jgi:hypothetical protein
LGTGATAPHYSSECLVENNTKDFDPKGERAAQAGVLSRRRAEQNRFVRNRGNGIWRVSLWTVRQCLGGQRDGDFHGITSGCTRDSVIVGNGFAATAGAWGRRQASRFPAAGLHHRTDVMAGNREGYNFASGRAPSAIHDRSERPCGTTTNSNATTSRPQSRRPGGAGSMKDNRHWPR